MVDKHEIVKVGGQGSLFYGNSCPIWYGEIPKLVQTYMQIDRQGVTPIVSGLQVDCIEYSVAYLSLSITGFLLFVIIPAYKVNGV